MLNLKKGLALVLAAATAFTFAPVANLGNAVQAEAANTVQIDGTTNANPDQTTSMTLSVGIWKLSKTDIKGASITIDGVAIDTDGTKAFAVKHTAGAPDNKGVVSIKIDSSSSTDNGTFTVTATQIRSTINTETTGSALNVSDYPGTLGNDTQDIKFTVSGVGHSEINATGVDNIVNLGKKYTEVNYKAEQTATFTYSAVDEKLAPFTSVPTLKAATTSDSIKNGTADYYFTYDTDNSGVDVLANTTDTNANGSVYIKGAIPGTTKLTVKAVSNKILKKDGKAGTGADVTAGNALAKGTTLAEATYEIHVLADTHNFSSVSWKLPNGKTNYADSTDVRTDALDPNTFTTGNTLNLDTLITKTTQINTQAAGAVSYVSNNPAVATVDQNGLVSAVSAGTATVTIIAAPVGTTNKQETRSITVNVSRTTTDVITAKVGDKDVINNVLEMDLSTSTAANAVKTAQIVAKSAAGFDVTYKITDDQNIITVTKDGLVTAGSKKGDAYITLSTADKGDIKGATATVHVRVNELPEAVITQGDIVLDLANHNTATLAPTSNVAGASFAYSETPDYSDGFNVIGLAGAKVTALKYGVTHVTITQPASKTTRLTKKKIQVSVVQNVAKAVSDLKVASSALTVKVGDTASAGASTTASGAAITYTSSDTDVATVAADGTITAVAPGTAVVTVKAAETDTVNAGTATIVVTVPSNPQKVTGVKVSNKKGAYVTVKWTSQGSNVNYRVYKKVGNGKWVGKNVAGSKTTLSVKKGAKVQVKVKSYVKDASGKTTWGPAATKAKTFKTDKK